MPIDTTLLAFIITTLAGAAGTYFENRRVKQTQSEKKQVIDFYDPASPETRITKDIPTQSYKMSQETRDSLLSGKSPEDQLSILRQISDAEYRMDQSHTHERYTITYSGGTYTIDFGLIVNPPPVQPLPAPTFTPTLPTTLYPDHPPLEPCLGIVRPTHITIKSGETVLWSVYFSPDSGPDEVIKIDVDFGDDTPIQSYTPKSGSGMISVQHVYEYTRPPDGKYTGKNFMPSFTLYGARGMTRRYEKIVAVVVQDLASLEEAIRNNR